MKTLIQVCLVLFVSIAFMQTIDAQEKEMKQSEITWNEAKDAYHKVMASTFHPAEEGDLAPLKKKHNVIAYQASEWAVLPIPKELRSKELKHSLKVLKQESKSIGKLVMSGASDDELTKAMFALHDVFHTIVGLCHHS